MFWMLTLKELKLIFKSLAFYLFVIIVILMYITRYGESNPLSINKPIQPLNEIQFMYTKMLEDYHDGKMINKALQKAYKVVMLSDHREETIKRFDKANSYSLNNFEKAAIKDALEKMNPGALKKNENILDIRFKVSHNEYLALMQKLDSSLGGYTYYADKEAKECLLAVENFYGCTEITDPVELMKNTYIMMKSSISNNSVMNINMGIETRKHISKEQKMLILNAIKQMLQSGKQEEANPDFKASYDECLSIVKDLDKQLGVNMFEEVLEGRYLFRGLTYEEAISDFNKLFERDKLTNAYARCLSDYMGITAGFLPILFAAFILIRDYRCRMNELIYSREVSSFVYVLSKFAAISIAVVFVYLAVATHSTVVFSKLAAIYSYKIDYLAFYKHILVWVMPTALFTTSVGLLVSLLFRNGIAAIVIQLILWYSSLIPLGGDYRLFKHIVRFNAVVCYEKYESWFNAIYINRLFFTLLSFALAAAASAVLSRRRSKGCGVFLGFLKNRSFGSIILEEVKKLCRLLDIS
jgi:ABC-type transport system involved in multi-copper enzyme maturation permease subunit